MKKANRLTRIIGRLAIVALLSGAATVAFAQSPNAGQKKYVATQAIIFDKATHKLRKPTEEETTAMVDQISALTNRSTDGLTVRELPNGTKQVNLQGRFSEVVIGRAHADGTVETRCVTSLDEAIAFLGLEEVK